MQSPERCNGGGLQAVPSSCKRQRTQSPDDSAAMLTVASAVIDAELTPRHLDSCTATLAHREATVAAREAACSMREAAMQARFMTISSGVPSPSTGGSTFLTTPAALNNSIERSRIFGQGAEQRQWQQLQLQRQHLQQQQQLASHSTAAALQLLHDLPATPTSVTPLSAAPTAGSAPTAAANGHTNDDRLQMQQFEKQQLQGGAATNVPRRDGMSGRMPEGSGFSSFSAFRDTSFDAVSQLRPASHCADPPTDRQEDQLRLLSLPPMCGRTGSGRLGLDVEGRTLPPQQASPFVMHLQRMSSSDPPPHQAQLSQGPLPACLDPSPVAGSQFSTALPASVLLQQQQQQQQQQQLYEQQQVQGWMAAHGPHSTRGASAGPVRIELSDAPPRLSLAGMDGTRRPAEGTVADLRIVRAPAAGHHAAPSPIVRLVAGTRKAVAAESAPAPDAKRERYSSEAHRSPSADPATWADAPAKPPQGSKLDLPGATDDSTIRASSSVRASSSTRIDSSPGPEDSDGEGGGGGGAMVPFPQKSPAPLLRPKPILKSVSMDSLGPAVPADGASKLNQAVSRFSGLRAGHAHSNGGGGGGSPQPIACDSSPASVAARSTPDLKPPSPAAGVSLAPDCGQIAPAAASAQPVCAHLLRQGPLTTQPCAPGGAAEVAAAAVAAAAAGGTSAERSGAAPGTSPMGHAGEGATGPWPAVAAEVNAAVAADLILFNGRLPLPAQLPSTHDSTAGGYRFNSAETGSVQDMSVDGVPDGSPHPLGPTTHFGSSAGETDGARVLSSLPKALAALSTGSALCSPGAGQSLGSGGGSSSFSVRTGASAAAAPLAPSPCAAPRMGAFSSFSAFGALSPSNPSAAAAAAAAATLTSPTLPYMAGLAASLAPLRGGAASAEQVAAAAAASAAAGAAGGQSGMHWAAPEAVGLPPATTAACQPDLMPQRERQTISATPAVKLDLQHPHNAQAASAPHSQRLPVSSDRRPGLDEWQGERQGEGQTQPQQRVRSERGAARRKGRPHPAPSHDFAFSVPAAAAEHARPAPESAPYARRLVRQQESSSRGVNTPRAAAPGRRAAAGAAAASQSCADPDQATPERWGNGAASVEGAVSHTKLLDCKSCDQILCLTKKMAAELLPPPIAATTTGSSSQVQVQVVDPAGSPWPVTYRCVPARYSYEFRAGWRALAAAWDLGAGDSVTLTRAGPDRLKLLLQIEYRSCEPPPPPRPAQQKGATAGSGPRLQGSAASTALEPLLQAAAAVEGHLLD